ncbi:FAD-dependent oxidoreductase [Calderihabitans maritimus]|uniref:NADPH-dependent glutamate synthase beta chain and related oxidoreductases n=1 Tax=Calderihabitans maritimus TaxID=1246530 RepID=A0A1Z5HY02_9FIRM|nr:FAD-dependent oxidoreductase [Calderihabitans maritimus]GAW94170.1 NADPH-dependent glutamate synthase beta chain and related oxidoreductases [Calderihabitans maritimus]
MFSTWKSGGDVLKTSLPSFGGQPVKAFIGWSGILIADTEVNLLEALIAYYEAVQRESCGRCVPCRVGTRIILSLLQKLAQKDDPSLRQQLMSVANLVVNGSKCELGQSAGKPVIDFLNNYQELSKYCAPSNSDQKYHALVTAPCLHRCPAHLDIPSYIERTTERCFEEALEVIRRSTALAGVLGRVCVHPCEEHCRRGLLDEPIAIRGIKRFVADYELKRGRKPTLKGEGKNSKAQVAVVGAGPAGLSCAYQLARKGYKVTIFEALPVAGGMLAVGIPPYRLPRDILQGEIEAIKALGVEIKYNTRVGQDISLQDLIQNYQAVFIAAGLHDSAKMGIEGENAGYEGFIPGVKYLRNMNLGLPIPAGKRVAVIGGGNVAMDCARSSLRKGFEEVYLIYRRTRAEMPANECEVRDAEAEGVKFCFLANPTEIVAEDGKVKGLNCIRMELGEPDASGRRRPVPIPGSEFFLPCDVVIPAIGQVADLSFLDHEGIELTKWKTIAVDPVTLATGVPGVFAGGDIVLGARTVVEAVAQGNRAAISIDQYLTSGKVEPVREDLVDAWLKEFGVFDPNERVGILNGRPRQEEEMAPVEERLKDFREVELGFNLHDGITETGRCLRCYRVGLMVLDSASNA